MRPETRNHALQRTAPRSLSLGSFGLQATCQLCVWAALYAGVNYSVALEALEAIGQDNVVY